jgi:hypothetical protein
MWKIVNKNAPLNIERAFKKWFSNVRDAKYARLKELFPKLSNLEMQYQKSNRLNVYRAFNKMRYDKTRLKMKVAYNLIRMSSHKLQVGYNSLYFNAVLARANLHNRRHACEKLYEIMEKKYYSIMHHRFWRWSHDAELRRKHIMNKYLLRLIFNTSVGYQIGFWRFKYVITKYGRQLNPLHSIIYKKLDNTLSACHRRFK